jgi:hypothetical protein
MNTVDLKLPVFFKTKFKLSDVKAKEFAESIKEEVKNYIKLENIDFKSSASGRFFKIRIKDLQNKSEFLKGL